MKYGQSFVACASGVYLISFIYVVVEKIKF